jgi:hypothetical protein
MQRFLALCSALAVATLSLSAFAAKAPNENFTLSAQTEVPGLTLQPGTYTIHVVGRLADRVILKMDDASGKTHVDFIGIHNPEVQRTQSGLVNWDQPVEGVTYLRGWVPPDGSSVIEFVYPKAQAVSIAKVNQAKVPAIDPASEGRTADPTLSKEDMKLVTLWLLSSTRVGPDSATPDIKAERYQKASPVPPKPLLASLPHTASALPLVLLLSLLSLVIAISLRRRRLSL